MTTLSATHTPWNEFSLGDRLRRAWQFNKFLTLTGLLHLALIPLLLLAWAVDPKTILGMPAWVKPLKFALSISIYSFTFLWLLTYVEGRARFKQIAANLTALGFVVEMAIIILQVVRDTTSHFNNQTPLDATLFNIMGSFIVLIALLNLLLAIWLIFQRLPDPVFAWGLRLGVLISFAGMAVAFLMTGPTPEQVERLQAGEEVAAIGAHSVGVEDGGPGLPIVGWSTEGGDLRVPHFVGLHGMQILPLVGWWLSRRPLRQRLTGQGRLLLVWTAGLAYLGLTGILTWQALRGQPIIAPDVGTWTALAVLVGATFIATVGVWFNARTRAMH